LNTSPHWKTLQRPLHKTPRNRPPSLLIRSLNAKKSRLADPVDLSNHYLPKLRVLPTFNTQHIAYSYGEISNGLPATPLRVQAPFPPGTRGFLYYHSPIGVPQTAGEIRLKKTDCHQDLQLPNGLPWSIPLLRISMHSFYREFKSLLLKEGLVTRQLMAECQAMMLSSSKRLLDNKQPTTIIHSFNQPFIVDFDRPLLNFWLLEDTRLRHVCLPIRFGVVDVPYKGTYSTMRICKYDAVY
jgi:hypothetical protein